MLEKNANPNITDKQGKNAMDLSFSPEILDILNKHIVLHNDDKISPIGEVTTYIISDFEDNDKSPYAFETFGVDRIGQVLNVSIASPDTEKSQEHFKLHPIYSWLEQFHLEECYEMLVSSGYFSSQALIKQMNGPMPISERNLRDAGIKKAGHRRLLLIKLEEEAGLSSKINILHDTKSKKFCFKCCTSNQGTKNISGLPTLNEWLEGMGLDHLYELFVDAGYESYEMLFEIQNSLHPLTSRILEQEVKINSLDQRMIILKKIQQDLGESADDNKLSFDGSLNSGCEFCVIQ